MPEENGLRLLAELAPRAPQTAVIMVTAEKEKRDRQYATSGGADGYVEKPFNPGSLFSEINRLMPRV